MLFAKNYVEIHCRSSPTISLDVSVGAYEGLSQNQSFGMSSQTLTSAEITALMRCEVRLCKLLDLLDSLCMSDVNSSKLLDCISNELLGSLEIIAEVQAFPQLAEDLSLSHERSSLDSRPGSKRRCSLL